ncbi:MAG: TIGR04282 family arsenosugar biosynthesis glycosyltransferase [Spongiibacteraceae bacterium]|nr:TIGR04282 family arsenosugar biosynthesis glycosyltransferase [Spongiibacteraceae bacterium]
MSEPVTVQVFAKAPAPGLAKTRLIPVLGADGAARLAARMLERTLWAAIAAELGPVQLWTTPAVSDPAWRGVALPPLVQPHPQGEGDLGARMARAASAGLAEGRPVVLIGTDCVEMSAALLQDAAAALSRCEAVIHPTLDGGYALLGLRRFDMTLFQDMPWSTDRVYSLTLARLRALHWRVQALTRLHDVDRPEDLERFRQAFDSVAWP